MPGGTQRSDLFPVVTRQMAVAFHGNTPSVSSTNRYHTGRGVLHFTLESTRVQPGIVEDPEGQVEGTLARQFDVTDAARISHYECGAYSTESRFVDLPNGGQETAWIFLSDPDLSVAPGEWRLENWQLRHKRRSLTVARAWMSRLDHSELVSLENEWR